MEFTAAEFEKAVSQFYHTDATLQAKAHEWLTAAQTTPEAWKFVWELLQPNKSTELQFFAATTLHTKVVKWWGEVPEDQYPVLKKKLLEAIVSYCLGPKIVLNRLCITLSAYMLQTMPNHWPDSISELLTTLQPSNLPTVPPQRTAWILLEILTVLPEEFQSSHLSQNQKLLVRNELQRNTPQVLSLLEEIISTNCCNMADEGTWEVIHQAVRCARSWLQMGISLPECMRLAELLISVIVNSVNLPNRHHLGNVSEAALDALCNMANHPDTSKFPTYCHQLFDKLVSLHPLLQQISGDDQELLSDLYCMFIAVAENHSKLLVSSLVSGDAGKDNALRLIHIVMQCSNFPGAYPVQETLSQHALGFWYILQDDMLVSEPHQLSILMQLLGPVYRMLAEIMLHKSMLPSDESSWSAEEREQLRCYRQDIADTMMYCYNVLHDILLEFLVQKLEEAIVEVNTSVKENKAGNRSPAGWQMLESVLHAFVSVAECLDPSEEMYVPRFVSALEQLPFGHLNLRVITSALSVIGSCAEWLNQHPTSMGHIVPLLVTGLGSPEVAPAATLALKDLARECRQGLLPYSHPVLQAAQESLVSGQLQQGECVRLMYTVGRLLSIMPMDQCMQYLEVMVVPYVNDLQRLSEQELTQARPSILLRVKMLSMLCGTLVINKPRGGGDADEQEEIGPVQPVFFLAQRMVPVAQNIICRLGTDDDIVQVVFGLFKSAISSVVEMSEGFLPDLMTLMMKSFSEHPHPATLELAQQIFILSAGRQLLLPSSMESFLKMICEITMKQYFCGTNLSEHCDVIEAFLKLLASVLKKHTHLFCIFEQNDCSALFQAATMALVLNESGVVRGAAYFLTYFITKSREFSHLLGTVQACGQALVHQILFCLEAAPRSTLEQASELLLVLNKKFCDDLSRWLPQALLQEGFPSQRLTAAEKEQFIRSILRERASKRKVQDIVRQFSYKCRGLVGVYD